jgi:PilZ domain
MGLTPTKFGSAEVGNSEADMPSVEAVPAVPAPGEAEAAAASKLDPLIGKFLRSLHVLLRAVRLYQRNHPRVTTSLETVDRDLRTILAQVPALSIKIERDGIIATTRQAPRNTRLLADLRGELKTLARELAGAGVSSLIFLRRINLGELALLAHALDAAARNTARHAGSRNWPAWLAEHRIAGIQINASFQRREETVLALLLAALPTSQAAEDTTASSGDQIRDALRFLHALNLRLDLAQQGSPQDAARIVRGELAAADPHTVSLLARAALQDPPLEGDSPAPYLARVADSLAVDFVRAEYLAERLRPAEIRSALAGLEDRNAQDAGQEARAEARIERFWAAVPARAIARVLSGPDAWCLPVPILRGYLAPLLTAAERKRAEASGNEARRALADFVRCLENERDSIRRAVAAGLVELSDLLPRLWPHPQLAGLETTIVSALAREKSPAPGVLLASATETLARLALERRSYGEFEKIVNDLEAVPAGSRDTVQPLARRLSEPQYWLPLVDAALANRALDPALPRLLQRDPARLLDRLGLLLTTSEGAATLPAMARLIRATDNSVLRALETDLSGSRRQRIATAIKLLSAAAPERLATTLAHTLAGWDWNLQDLAVTELAHQANPNLRRQVAHLFLDLLKDAHLHVVPGMIDLIALAREDSAVPRLLEMATGDTVETQDIFVRIKAVEALGRLRATAAAPRLRELSTKRSGLTYVYPAGLRAAAEEALELLEGRLPAVANAASVPLHGSTEAPEKTGPQFSRPRRYQRVSLESPLSANIEGTQSAPARVRAIALGGALVETGSPLAIGESMRIEIHAGLGRIRSTAVVRNASPEGYGVEFVHMDQEDREKLRRRLVKLLQ